MLGEVKTLFNNTFFEKALKIIALNNQEFLIRYFTIDSRIIGDTKLFCFVGVKGENFDGNDYFEDAYKKGMRVFVLNKLPHEIPQDAIIYLVEDTIHALGILAKLHKKDLVIPHIMITGSGGKTTTRLMLAHILKEKYPIHTARKNWNNYLGVPLTILETGFDAKISILEAGMSSKGEISFLSNIVNPDIAIITNVWHSHTKFLGGLDQVAEAKIEIVDGMNEGSLLLINYHDPYKDFFISKAKGTVKFFNPDDLFIIEDRGLDGFVFGHKEFHYEQFFCPIAGTHLLLNLAIVFKCIDILQIPTEMIHKGLKNIQIGLDNRMRIFTINNNIKIIADCYNASLESFKAALNVLSKSEGRRIAIIGSILELGKESKNIHKHIGQYLSAIKAADLVLAVGEDIGYTCQELKEIPYCHCAYKEEIWEIIQKELQANDTILIKASHGIGLEYIVSCLENY